MVSSVERVADIHVPGRAGVRSMQWRIGGWISLVLPAAVIAAWFVASSQGWVKPYQLASPGDVVRELEALAAQALLLRHVEASAERVAIGFFAALVAAVALATVAGLSRTAERLFDPTLQAIRSVPSLAWVPLLLIWMGIGEPAKITLVAIGAFFPIYVSLVAGIHGIDRKLIEVARVFGLRGGRLAWRVVLPAALPSLLVGARIGLTQAWLFLVAAELLASTKGLGYMLIEGEQISRSDEIIVAIILLALCGKLCEGAMKALERRVLRWRDVVQS